MRAVTIVMVNEPLEDAQKMPALRDHQPVQTFGPNRSDEAFHHRVRCGRSPWRPHHLDTGAAKHRVELTREFLVAISDEKSRCFDPLRERPRELASLLRHPLCGGMARAARQVHATARELHEEEHRHSLEPDGLHGEEVDREHGTVWFANTPAAAGIHTESTCVAHRVQQLSPSESVRT